MENRYLLLVDLNEKRISKVASTKTKEIFYFVRSLRSVFERSGWNVEILDDGYVGGVSAYMFVSGENVLFIIECYE